MKKKGLKLGWKTNVNKFSIITSISLSIIWTSLIFIGGSFFISDTSNIGIMFSNNYFNKASDFYSEHSELVDAVYYICQYEEGTLKRVNCIYDILNDRIKYDYKRAYPEEYETDELKWFHTKTLLSPDEAILTESSVCRDFAVSYSAILKKLNIKHKFILDIKDHIYLEVYPNENESALWKKIILDNNNMEIIEK